MPSSALRLPTPEDYAYSSLAAYAVYQWPGYRPAAHHIRIARALERVERGECRRLMICMPPRHGKSMLASEYFPAWYLGRNPERYVIHATYAQELAEDFGRKVRNQMIDSSFAKIFPGVQVRADSASAKRFNTNHNGTYYALGVGGPATGRGAHCFVAGTMVLTDTGPCAIEQLQMRPSPVMLASYSHEAGRNELQPLQAFSVREGRGIYRVTTAAGRVVEATGDHPFYVPGRGYVEARHLAAGDPLLCAVWEDVHAPLVRDGQGTSEGAPGCLLLGGMQRIAPRSEEPQALRDLQRPGGEKDPQVLRVLPAASTGEEASAPADPLDVPDVQHGILGGVARAHGGPLRRVLRKAMRAAGALAAHGRQWKPQVETRGHAGSGAAALGKGIQDHASSNFGARRQPLRLLRRWLAAARGAPHRQLADEQRIFKFGDALLPVPPQAAPGARLRAGHDSVARVERLRETARVYDIQVSKNHNFYAEGILVHNCLLIDDPIKGREDADSDTIRRKLKDWYTSVAYTRLMPDSAIVLINTRWHFDDLSGWQLKEFEHEGWELLSLPAIDAEGKALWPSDYPIDRLEAIKRTVGSRDWSALYQQNPIPDEGGLLKLPWFRRYGTAPVEPEAYMVVQSWDTAYKPAQINDPSVCTTWLVTVRGYYLLDVWRGHVDYPTLKRTAINLAGRWKPGALLIEDKASGQSLIQELRTSTSLPVIAIDPQGDKVTRANSISPMIEAGLVYLPEQADWLVDFEAEVGGFPLAAHDDQVDSLTQALEWMRTHTARHARMYSSGQVRAGYAAGSSHSLGGGDAWGNMGANDTAGFL